jgi:hypothetical protein
MVMNYRSVVAPAIFALAVSFVPAAHASTYNTSGTSELFSLGDQLGGLSSYDQLIVGGVSGTLQAGTITLDALTFIAGVNAFVPATYQYSFSETMTVNGVTENLTIPFDISINTSDTLTILGGTTASFTVNGTVYDISVNGLTIGPNPGGAMSANLTAHVTDPPATPLPTTIALFAGGLSVIGLLGWGARRRGRTASPTGA